MFPLVFEPLIKPIRWGGTRLRTLLGKEIGDLTDAAESWELADHGSDQTRVAYGPHVGETLGDLVRSRPVELFGASRFDQFPLLIKFLDANDRLSVQVHPNDEQAKAYDPTENGKTEAWVIMHAEPGSVLYAGLKSGVDRERFQSAISEGVVAECLHTIKVKTGDCVFIPAGTVHAIGEGIVLAEIQQQSDLTFRVDDWGRVGTDGKPRELHVADSLAVTDFERGPVEPVIPSSTRVGANRHDGLVSCDYFTIRRHHLTEPFQLPVDEQMRVVMTLEGRGACETEGQVERLAVGQTVLVPASSPDPTLIPEGELTVLEAFVPVI